MHSYYCLFLLSSHTFSFSCSLFWTLFDVSWLRSCQTENSIKRTNTSKRLSGITSYPPSLSTSPPSPFLLSFLSPPYRRAERGGTLFGEPDYHECMWSYKILDCFPIFFQACLYIFLVLTQLITKFMALGLEIILLVGTTAYCRTLKLPLWYRIS